MDMRSFLMRNIPIFFQVSGLVVMLSFALPVAAESITYPRAPLNPTYEDCHNLYMSFLQLAQQLTQENNQCMSNPPIVDWVNECGRRVKRAWAQCTPIATRRCELDARQKEEVELCRSRIRQPEETGGKKVLDTLAKADELYGKYEDTTAFIRNPKEYLKQALQDKFSGLYRELFPSLYGGGQDDLAGISVMYTYAYQYAEKGVSASPDPLVGRIQKEAFDLIAIQHQRTLNKLDRLEHEIARFGSELGPQAQKEKSRNNDLEQENGQIKRILVGQWGPDEDEDDYKNRVWAVFRADGTWCGRPNDCTEYYDENAERWVITPQRRVRYTSRFLSAICEIEELKPERMTARCYGIPSNREGRTMNNLETLDLTQFEKFDGTETMLRR